MYRPNDKDPYDSGYTDYDDAYKQEDDWDETFDDEFDDDLEDNWDENLDDDIDDDFDYENYEPLHWDKDDILGTKKQEDDPFLTTITETTATVSLETAIEGEEVYQKASEHLRQIADTSEESDYKDNQISDLLDALDILYEKLETLTPPLLLTPEPPFWERAGKYCAYFEMNPTLHTLELLRIQRRESRHLYYLYLLQTLVKEAKTQLHQQRLYHPVAIIVYDQLLPMLKSYTPISLHTAQQYQTLLSLFSELDHNLTYYQEPSSTSHDKDELLCIPNYLVATTLENCKNDPCYLPLGKEAYLLLKNYLHALEQIEPLKTSFYWTVIQNTLTELYNHLYTPSKHA